METISEPEERYWMKTPTEPEVSEFSFLDTADIKDIGFSFDSSPKNEEYEDIDSQRKDMGSFGRKHYQDVKEKDYETRNKRL